MSILGGLFGGIYLASSGGSKKQVQTPPINAGSKDEEKFVQYVPPSYLCIRGIRAICCRLLRIFPSVGDIDTNAPAFRDFLKSVEGDQKASH